MTRTYSFAVLWGAAGLIAAGLLNLSADQESHAKTIDQWDRPPGLSVYPFKSLNAASTSRCASGHSGVSGSRTGPP